MSDDCKHARDQLKVYQADVTEALPKRVAAKERADKAQSERAEAQRTAERAREQAGEAERAVREARDRLRHQESMTEYPGSERDLEQKRELETEATGASDRAARKQQEATDAAEEARRELDRATHAAESAADVHRGAIERVENWQKRVDDACRGQ